MGAWSLCPTKGLGTFPGVVLDLPRKNEAGNGGKGRGVDYVYRIPRYSSLHQAEHKLQLDAAAQRLKWGIPEEQWANSWNCDPHPWAVFIEPTIDFRMMPVSSSASVDDRSEPFDIQARLTRNVSTFTMWDLSKNPLD